MCSSEGANITEPASAFGSHQNRTMMTLECAKCKDSHFKVGNEDGPGLQYSVASVWSLADHVKTQSRLKPLGLLDWREAGIGYVGQIRHSDQCPKNLHLKRPMERKLDLRLSRDDTCKLKTYTDWSPLKLSKGRCWMGPLRPKPRSSSSGSHTHRPQEEQQHINFNNCSYFLSCQQLLM